MNRGADHIATVLADTGIDKLFSLSGNQIMPLYDACLEPGISIVHTRHEAAAVFMAEAYAQLSARPGIALVTAAPGFANALGALYSAKQSETPVILLSGDSPVASDGRGSFQEMDQSSAAKPFVKLTQRVTDISCFREQWQLCLQHALGGNPGPVHLSLPFDVLNQVIEIPVSQTVVNTTDDLEASGSSNDIDSIYQFLAQAARPLVLLGPNLCRPYLQELRQRLASSLDLVPVCMESPRGLGDPVLGNLKSVCRQADRVLLLGKKPDFTIGFGDTGNFADARFAAVISGTANQQLISNNLGERCDFNLNAAPQIFAERLCEHSANVKVSSEGPVGSDRLQWNREVTKCLEQRPVVEELADSALLHPARITAAVEHAIAQVNAKSSKVTGKLATKETTRARMAASEKASALSDASVLICDGGEFGQWAQAGVRVPLRMINGPSGAIGGSLACAVGASAARPESLVFVMLGDGTAGFYLAELETIARERVPAIVIIGNDSCWNAEHQIQLDQYGESRTHSCQLPPGLSYDGVAQSLGMVGEQIETGSALDDALSRAVERASNRRQATLLNVIMQGQKAPSYV